MKTQQIIDKNIKKQQGLIEKYGMEIYHYQKQIEELRKNMSVAEELLHPLPASSNGIMFLSFFGLAISLLSFLYYLAFLSIFKLIPFLTIIIFVFIIYSNMYGW